MSSNAGSGPVVLIVRDGWGRNPHPEHDPFNAVRLARTPVCDGLLRNYPWTLIRTSGEDVGLPDGTMGNSEVGHQNLGAGRIVDQESVRITKEIHNGAFFHNRELVEATRRASEAGRTVHLMGIASDAGVHGLLAHLYACLQLCRDQGQDRVALHLFTDGRDTGPFTGKEFVARIEDRCAEIGVGRVATISGRYYAMDRDNRWERVEQAYRCLTDAASSRHASTASEAIRIYYDRPTGQSQVGDEFIIPTAVGSDLERTRIRNGDSVIFYNYRGDRPRELIRAFMLDDKQWARVPPSPDTKARGFDRGPRLDLHFVTLTAYEEGLPVRVAFPKPPKMKNTAGGYLATRGLHQFRCAETEKFPHVTFFFNDYREEPFDGENRQMAQSPRVATYDQKPEMSGPELTAIVVGRLRAADCEDFILVNFANGDMVGHTGKLDAAIKAIETVDASVGRIVAATLDRGGRLIVTADHGNAEQMFDPDTNCPHTAHTTYDVECIVVSSQRRNKTTGSCDHPGTGLREGGRLADVLPTVLVLMGLDKPDEMTGASLV